MIATHRVKNSDNETVGFIVGNQFINSYLAKLNIRDITNIKLLTSGKFRAKNKLPVIYLNDLNRQRYNKLLEENPFIRDIEFELNKWRKEYNAKVIQLHGPRQVGKTTEIQKFAYKNYEYIIYIDLSDKTGDLFKKTIENSQNKSDLNAILDFMSAYCDRANLPEFNNSKKTILVIDEIQTSSSIYNMIRTIRAKYNIDIIVTGSYLGHIINSKEYFLPAGTIRKLDLYSLSFREFTRIFKLQSLLDSISIFGESKQTDYDKLYKLYDIYRQIGGYPEVVKTYIKTQNILECKTVIKDLISVFIDESRHYFNSDRHDIIFRLIFDQAFKQMCSNKKGSKLVEDISNSIKSNNKNIINKEDINKSLVWILYSGILGDCTLCTDGDIRNTVPARRVYYMDCGIANYISSGTGIDKTSIDELMAETFVYGELYRLYLVNEVNKKVNGSKPCFSTLGNYELDFMLLDTDNKIYGIEVKAKEGTSKSLSIYIQKGLVNRGIVAKRTTGHNGDKLSSIPIWAVGCRFPYT